MLAMVNMKPDSRNAGRNVGTMAIWLASNWLLVTMLMSMPIASTPDQEDRRHAEQQRHAAAQRDVEDELAHQHGQQHVAHADDEIGHELAQDQFRRLTGVEISCSIVPRSHSRATVSEVSIAAMTIMITAIRPGTM